MSEASEMVTEFHELFNLPIRKRPRLVAKDAMLRAAVLTEETAEFVTALSNDDIIKAADAIADIIYVAYGAAVTFGIDADAVLKEVHKSNLTKLDVDSSPIKRKDGKIRKGSRYKPPDIARVLGIKEKA